MVNTQAFDGVRTRLLIDRRGAGQSLRQGPQFEPRSPRLTTLGCTIFNVLRVRMSVRSDRRPQSQDNAASFFDGSALRAGRYVCLFGRLSLTTLECLV